MEFDEVRLYQPGDDARDIDWRVTARRGRPHTKVYREEREMPVMLLVDLGPGMFFGTRRQFKSALAARAAALCAWAAMQAAAGSAVWCWADARADCCGPRPAVPACWPCSRP